jgi:hypothetical protein
MEIVEARRADKGAAGLGGKRLETDGAVLVRIVVLGEKLLGSVDGAVHHRLADELGGSAADGCEQCSRGIVGQSARRSEPECRQSGRILRGFMSEGNARPHAADLLCAPRAQCRRRGWRQHARQTRRRPCTAGCERKATSTRLTSQPAHERHRPRYAGFVAISKSSVLSSSHPCIQSSIHQITHASNHPCIQSPMHQITHASNHQCDQSSMHHCIQSPMHPIINPSIHHCIDASNHPCIKSPMHQITHASNHPCIKSPMHPIIDASNHRCIKSSAHQCIKSSVLQVIDASNHRLL